MAENTYDVIIIGGRPAGASLAIRLSQGGLNVLVVDRATFPSKPAVPSMPVILPHTLALLDELGLSESEVEASGSKLLRLQLEMNGHFAAEIDFVKAMEDDPRRKYFYSIKRDLFDHALWELMASQPNVTAKQDYGVTQLLKDESGKVIGIQGNDGSQFMADLVVGADGRFSFVANQVDAQIIEEVTDNNTDFYFAYWRGGDYERTDAMSTMHIYSSLQRYQYLIFPVGENEVAVSVQMAHDLIPKSATESIEDYYTACLQKYPRLWNQVKDAERISQVWAMKNVRNGYRQAGGEGWALVGDALHFKDSIDAQGIYDALSCSKLLAPYILDWKAGKRSWADSVTAYQTAHKAETHDMFMETQGRLKREVYDEPPAFIVKNVLRRVIHDPLYQKQFIGYVTRRFNPKGWASPALMLGSLVRGIGRDIRNLFK